MSCTIILRSSVDLPLPDAPIRCMWRTRCSVLIVTATRLPGVMILAEHERVPEGERWRRFRLALFALELRRSGRRRRQMNERHQFVAVQEHARAAAPARDDISAMLVRRHTRRSRAA